MPIKTARPDLYKFAWRYNSGGIFMSKQWGSRGWIPLKI